MKRLALLLAALVALAVLPLRAQDETVDDKTFLENWLQTNLSGAGRQVTVTGFEGALSSQATMQRMTIADDEGVWLTLEDAELDWTRSALLTGRLEVDALTAKRIVIARRPVTQPSTPSATASDFALPELPVSINIGRIQAEELELGASVLGVAAVLRLDGEGWLEGGEGAAKIVLERIDGPRGRFAVSGDYANETKVLGLDLALSEGEGGIAATLTGLPGAVPIDLTLKGRGPMEDFGADLDLATDGTSRLTGRVDLAKGDMEALGEVPEGATALAFSAVLNGDPGALLAGDYKTFFGPGSNLTLTGQRAPDGRMRIDAFDIATDALRLGGTALIGANGWPERAQLTGAITPPEGDAVLLPMGGAPTRLAGAELAFDYDAAKDDGWTGRLVATRIDRPELDLAAISLVGTGTLEPGQSGALPAIAGHLDLRLSGIAAPEGSAVAALGQSLQGRLDFTRASGAPLALSNMALEGADYRLTGAVTLDTDVTRLDVLAEGAVTLEADDLSRFAALSGQDLSGAAELAIEGKAALPGGAIEAVIDGTAQDLAIGVAELDPLFAGASTLSLAAARDEAGTRIDRFVIAAPGAKAEASGVLAPAGSRLAITLDLPDAAPLAEGLSGPVSVTASAAQESGARWAMSLAARGPGGADVQLDGTAAIGADGLGAVSGKVQATIASLAPYSGLAGRSLAGQVALEATGAFDPSTNAFDLTGTAKGNGLSFALGSADVLTRGVTSTDFALRRDTSGMIFVDGLRYDSPNLTLRATGDSTAEVPKLILDARLSDLALLVPGLPGAFAVQGTASLDGSDWAVDLGGTGPGGMRVSAKGTLAGDGAGGDLALSGQAPLALANGFIAPRQMFGTAGFDLRLAGPFALTSLSGQVTTGDARISLPTYGLALDPVRGRVALSGGQATLDLVAALSSGGQISVQGPVALTAPYSGNLGLRLAALRLTDPMLYDIELDGQLGLSGPLTGGALISGQIALGKAELQIPETGLGADGSLEGIVHVGEPAAVYATRARAGMTGSGAAGGGGRPFGLDITVSAPRAIFLRGRGLDTELGGSLRLGGTTDNVVAQGGFDLVRGRLDLLGNRLTLTEGNVTMRGSLDPAVHLVAETQAEDVTVWITVDGLASDPSVSFTSSPGLPEDEILARLIFGRGLDQISPFQALKLASAVATLSGRSGAGTIGRLRQGFGLDDLDVTTDENGDYAATAGAYISDRIYTDVTVGADGKAEINLNLTLTPSITARGGMSTDGNTGIGVFFEKDY